MHPIANLPQKRCNNAKTKEGKRYIGSQTPIEREMFKKHKNILSARAL